MDYKVNPQNGIKGVDTTLEPCPECGGYPRIHKYLFDIRKEGIKRTVKGREYTVIKETRIYMSCQCCECVIDWCRPTYKKDGSIKESALERARKEWKKKHFLTYTFDM